MLCINSPLKRLGCFKTCGRRSVASTWHKLPKASSLGPRHMLYKRSWPSLHHSFTIHRHRLWVARWIAHEEDCRHDPALVLVGLLEIFSPGPKSPALGRWLIGLLKVENYKAPNYVLQMFNPCLQSFPLLRSSLLDHPRMQNVHRSPKSSRRARLRFPQHSCKGGGKAIKFTAPEKNRRRFPAIGCA